MSNKVKLLFDKYKDEFLKFDRMENTTDIKSPDLYAFVLLDKLMPSNHDMIAAAEHDQIWLRTDMETFGIIPFLQGPYPTGDCPVRGRSGSQWGWGSSGEPRISSDRKHFRRPCPC